MDQLCRIDINDLSCLDGMTDKELFEELKKLPCDVVLEANRPMLPDPFQKPWEPLNLIPGQWTYTISMVHQTSGEQLFFSTMSKTAYRQTLVEAVKAYRQFCYRQIHG